MRKNTFILEDNFIALKEAQQGGLSYVKLRF